MRLLTTTLALLLVAAAPAGANTFRQRLYDPASGVMVVAHRGCHAAAPAHGFPSSAPENSLEALQRCIDIGVDMVEADVRRTQDGVLVIMHDPSVNRTTDGDGLVSTLTLAQFQALRLEGADEAPPTLEAFLRAARGRVLVTLHLKGPLPPRPPMSRAQPTPATGCCSRPGLKRLCRRSLTNLSIETSPSCRWWAKALRGTQASWAR